MRYLSYRTHFDKQLNTENEKKIGIFIIFGLKTKPRRALEFLEQGQEKEEETKKQNTIAICRVCTGCVMRCRFHNAGTVFSPATTAAPHSTCVATIPALPSFSSSMRRHSYYSSSLSRSLSLFPSQCTRVCRCARGIALEAEMEFIFRVWGILVPVRTFYYYIRV